MQRWDANPFALQQYTNSLILLDFGCPREISLSQKHSTRDQNNLKLSSRENRVCQAFRARAKPASMPLHPRLGKNPSIDSHCVLNYDYASDADIIWTTQLHIFVSNTESRSRHARIFAYYEKLRYKPHMCKTLAAPNCC